jgi:phosphoglycolate phosphatase
MSKTFKLLVFDWDGTVMDSESRIVACVDAAIADLDLPQRSIDEVKNIIGLGLKEAVQTLFPGSGDELLQNIVERYRYHYLTADKTPSPLFPGARETLEQLNEAGYLLAVATGKGRAGLEKVFEETNTREFFVTSRCADESFSKPHPQMLEAVIDFCGVMPDDTLMIGDTEYDMQMAVNANASALAVCYGVHTPERLMQSQPLGCVESITDIPLWLQQYSR